MANTDESKITETLSPRKVSHKLSIGIFFLPIVFYWYLLQKGYSTKVRVIWGIWLFAGVIKILSAIAGTDSQASTPVAQTQAVVQEQVQQANVETETTSSDFVACDSKEAETEIISTMESAPLGRVHGLSIIKLSKAAEVSRTDKELKCKAEAQLNNAEKYPIKYKFYKDGEDIMIEAELVGLE